MVSRGAEGMLSRTEGRTEMPLLMRHQEDKEGGGRNFELESGNLGPRPRSVTHSTFDLGKVNFSLDLIFPV